MTEVCRLSIISAKTMLQFFTFILSQHQCWYTDATNSSNAHLSSNVAVQCENRPNSTILHISSSHGTYY